MEIENSNKNHNFTCSYCKEEEPMAFLKIINITDIKLIGINCLFEKSQSSQLNKEDCIPLNKLKITVENLTEKTLNSFEVMKSLNIDTISELNDVLKTSVTRNENEIEKLKLFLENLINEIDELTHTEHYKKIKEESNSLLKAKKILNKLNEFDKLREEITNIKYINDPAEVYLVSRNLFSKNQELNLINFENEVKNCFKELNSFAGGRNKSITSEKPKENIVPNNLKDELNENINNLRKTVNKIKAFVLKKDVDINSGIQQGYELKHNNIIDHYEQKNCNGTKYDNDSFIESSSEFTFKSNRDNNNITDIYSKTQINNNFKPPNIEKEKNSEMSNQSIQLRLGNNKWIYNESYKYLIHVDISNCKSLPPIIIFDTSTAKFYEKDIVDDLKKINKSILSDSRYINTGNGIILCGGNEKPNYSKVCLSIMVESVSEDKLDVLVSPYNDLIEGRKRHNLVKIKSKLFDNEKKEIMTAFLAISGFKITSCEYTVIDKFKPWCYFPSLNCSRSNGSTLIMNECVYVFGGHMVVSSPCSNEEYLNSFEKIKIEDIANSSSMTPQETKWDLFYFKHRENYLDKCAFSVIYNISSKDEDNCVIIVGGFKNQNSKECYKVKIHNEGRNEDWEVIQPTFETFSENLFFLNNNFVLGENGNSYAFSYSNRLVEYQKSLFSLGNEKDAFRIIDK